MAQPVVFWGASGHARVLRELVESVGYQLVALFDNNLSLQSPFADIPLFHRIEGFTRWRVESKAALSVACLVAIGGALGRDRLALQRTMVEAGLEAIVVIHPTAFVAPNVRLGAGCQVLAQAAVCAEATLGDACIVNTKASVDHECRIGEGVHIAPGATLAGCVCVSDYTLIGPGAIILPRIRIGSNVVIGGGSVVTRDIPDNVIAYGNPARVVRTNAIANNR